MQTLKQVAKAHRFAVMQPAAVQARNDERLALDAAIAATPHRTEQIVLDLPVGKHRWSGYHTYPSLGFDLFDHAAQTCGHWQRTHGCEFGRTWFGRAVAYDQHGNRWERSWDAVVDDFGNLVEVQ